MDAFYMHQARERQKGEGVWSVRPDRTGSGQVDRFGLTCGPRGYFGNFLLPKMLKKLTLARKFQKKKFWKAKNMTNPSMQLVESRKILLCEPLFEDFI